MADGTFSNVRRFDDKEQLRVIREQILNPLATQVKNVIDPKVTRLDTETRPAFVDATLNTTTEILTFTGVDGKTKTIDFSTITGDDFPGITVVGDNGTKTGIKTISFPLSNVVGTGANAEVDYHWDDIVQLHQRDLVVDIDGTGEARVKKVVIKNPKDRVEFGTESVEITIPDDPEKLKAEIDGTAGESEVHKVIVKGNVGTSEVKDGILNIVLPEGGAAAAGHFKGFFGTLGDLESAVTDPINGRSYAFVKDQLMGSKYYTPYMYVGGNWTEAPIDPAITYADAATAEQQGVFSIKPSSFITIDSKGQIDLDGLRGDGDFHGFFENQKDLESAVPKPLLDKSFAYVKVATGGWLGKKYSRNSDGTTSWVGVTPYGLLSGIAKDSSGSIVTAKPIHSLEDNAMVNITNGVATILGTPEPEKTILVKAKDSDEHVEQEVAVKGLHFIDGIYVDLSKEKDWAVIQHPQRVIHYSSDFEKKHDSATYLGHFFFDDTSSTWMGYSPDLDDITAPKWSRVAHRGMSDQVNDIWKRFPVKAPSLIPDVNTGDNRAWQYSSWSYVENAPDVGFDDKDYNGAGVYLQTYVFNHKDDGATPKGRMQIGYIDREPSEVWYRMYDPTATDPNPVWKDWNKLSVNELDLHDHNDDPAAHRAHMKYYKVSTINLEYVKIRNQSHTLLDKDMMLVADSHGLTRRSKDYSSIPYTGKFKFTGCLDFDRQGTTATPTGDWIFRVVKRPVGTADEHEIGRFKITHSNTKAKYKPMYWHLPAVDLNAGDNIYYYLSFSNDSNLVAWAPKMFLIPFRSYIAVEDFETESGSMIADTYLKSLGSFQLAGNVAAKVHNRNYDPNDSFVRVYGAPMDNDYSNMPKQ